MLKRLRRIACVVLAAAAAVAVSVNAFADYTYSMDDSQLCDEIKADTKDINGTEGTFTTKFSDSTGDDFLSLRFRLFNEYADLEFWNNDEAYVSIDVRLDTEGKDVIGCMPAFTTSWGWVNPSDYTQLKYGEWITITETAKHFYEGFDGKKPAYIMFQVRTNWGSVAQDEVTISVKNFRIVTGGSADEGTESTTSAESEATSAADTTSAESTAEELVIQTQEAASTAENPAAEISQEGDDTASTAEAAASTTAADDDSSTPPADDSGNSSAASDTSVVVPDMEGEQPQNYGEYWEDNYQTESPVATILIIVGVAVLIAGGAVVGYLIYRKKKYY